MSQIGTIKVETQNGAVELPVFNPSDLGNNVYNFIRVATESGIGVIPFTDPSSAAYNHIKIQTENNGVIACHDKPNLVNVDQIEVDVSLDNQNIELTIYEDLDGDETAENTETISLTDGTNTYTLNNLDGGSGNTYWIKWNLSNTDITKTAKANYADLKDVGKWGSANDWDNAQTENGVVHESATNTDNNDSDVIKQGYSVINPLYSSNLIGYWPLHEDSGSTAYDFSGNGNEGSINGATVGK